MGSRNRTAMMLRVEEKSLSPPEVIGCQKFQNCSRASAASSSSNAASALDAHEHPKRASVFILVSSSIVEVKTRADRTDR